MRFSPSSPPSRADGAWREGEWCDSYTQGSRPVLGYVTLRGLGGGGIYKSHRLALLLEFPVKMRMQFPLLHLLTQFLHRFLADGRKKVREALALLSIP